MNEIVRYNNNLNNIDFGIFKATELNLFMGLICRIRPKYYRTDDGLYVQEKLPDEIILGYREIKAVLGLNSKTTKERLSKRLSDTNRKILNTICETRDGNKLVQFVLFPTFENDPDKEQLRVCINTQYGYLLTDIAEHFTRFELEEFISLPTVAAKVLYIDIKQNRMWGTLVYDDINLLRRRFGLGTKYSTSNITSKVMEPAYEKVSMYIPGLKLDVIKSGREHKTVGYRFTFTPEKVPQALKQEQKSNTIRQNTTGDKPKNIKTRNQFLNFPQRKHTKEDYDRLERKKLMELDKKYGG